MTARLVLGLLAAGARSWWRRRRTDYAHIAWARGLNRDLESARMHLAGRRRRAGRAGAVARRAAG